jgi:hypothetical protein
MNFDEQIVFEDELQEIFCGRSMEDIKREISYMLKEDSDFREKYETWIEESSYDSWMEYYKVLEEERGGYWKDQFPDDDENDEITDFLTME